MPLMDKSTLGSTRKRGKIANKDDSTCANFAEKILFVFVLIATFHRFYDDLIVIERDDGKMNEVWLK